MGWLKALRSHSLHSKSEPIEPQAGLQIKSRPNSPEVSHVEDISVNSKSEVHNVSHVENTSTIPHASLGKSPSFPFASPDTADVNLPFLSAAEVAACDRTYVVVDKVVFDCTQFVYNHPGGPQVIESFRGQDCSWQFWRFHSEDNMREWGRPLRVARTEGVMNRWKERPRFVGLRRLGATNEEDW